MTDHTDLIARLRDTASRGVSVWGDLQMEAADALEAAQAEIDMHMRVATNAIDHVVTLKAEIEAVRKANVDCVNHFDALRIDYDKALARLAVVEEANSILLGRNKWLEHALAAQPSQGLQSVADALTIEQLNDKVERLMAVQPSQADAQDAARYRWLREYLPSDDLQYDDNLVLAKTGEDIDAAIDAAINAKESK